MRWHSLLRLASVVVILAIGGNPRVAVAEKQPGGGCTSGGPGSSSCSLGGWSSCSVTCQPGNYACCNYFNAVASCYCLFSGGMGG